MVRIQQFESKQRKYTFNRERSSIYKISIEKVRVRLRRQPVDLKDIHQIVILAVNIPADREFLIVWYGDVY